MEMIVIYGLMVCACAFLAWRSGDLTLQKLSALVTLDWAAGNLSFQYFGPLDPWIAPSLGVIFIALIGWLLCTATEPRGSLFSHSSRKKPLPLSASRHTCRVRSDTMNF